MRVMLKMIAKKVARYKGPYMVSTLTPRLLLVIWRMFSAVRKVGAKNEQLERAQNSRKLPE
jgi:hypothetical protein